MIEKPELSWLAQKRHDKFHHPNGLVAEPYLTLPFDQKDLVYDITEGFRYSRSEQKLHGGILHCGIDFAVPYGTPVVAPGDGIAIASYHSVFVRDKDGNVKLYEDKFLGFGLGYFIQIHLKGLDRIVQLGHLSNIYSEIPFSQPVEIRKGEWMPTNHQSSYRELSHNNMAVPVKTGDLLGWVGYSGMRWGYDDYEKGSVRPIIINPQEKVSYDEPHVHMEECKRNQKGEKVEWRDLEDIYMSAKHYPTPTRYRVLGPEPLFFTKNGLPILAK